VPLGFVAFFVPINGSELGWRIDEQAGRVMEIFLKEVVPKSGRKLWVIKICLSRIM